MSFRSYWFTSGVTIPTRAQGDGGLSCQPLHTCGLSRLRRLDAPLERITVPGRHESLARVTGEEGSAAGMTETA